MTEKTVIALGQVLVDTYAVYVKTQGFHWNVTGPQFHDLHGLFESQYDELAEAVDTLAERIRALGVRIPAGLKVFAQQTKIQDGDVTNSARSMLQVLRTDHQALVAELKVARSVAAEHGDAATEDLMIERIASHEKTIWMLSATLEG